MLDPKYVKRLLDMQIYPRSMSELFTVNIQFSGFSWKPMAAVFGVVWHFKSLYVQHKPKN